jgi:FHA domain/Domain of unknown function (DUF1707)
MTGSAADTPTTPEYIRVSDVDRDRAVDDLKQEYVHGRLSHDTFMLRMHAALGARNQGQLSGLFTDLPQRRSRLARVREALLGWRRPAPDADTTAPASAAWNLVPRQQEPAPSRPPLPEPRPLIFPPGPDTNFTIGRDNRCDLYIDDMSVSRLHARLARDGDGWVLADLGSTNGTRLNGWRVRAAVPVRAGDLILFGSVAFIVAPQASPSG